MKKKLSVSIVFLLSLNVLSSLGFADDWVAECMLMLNGAQVRNMEIFAKGFDVTRSPGIQAALLDEHILWANSDSTDEERALYVAMALHMAEGRALKELLKEDIEEKRKAKLQQFSDKVDVPFEKYKKLAKGLTDSEIRRLRLRP